MDFPVIISDTDGRIVYKSRSVNTGGFLSLYTAIKRKSKESGMVVFSGRSYCFRHVSLCGRKYIIASPCPDFDFTKTKADNALDRLFDIQAMSRERINITLERMTELFMETYAEELFKEGIRVVVHKLAKNVAAEVSPKLFMLALALMARLVSCNTGAVRFTFADECGRVTVYADSDGTKHMRRKEDEVLEFMLYEAAAKSGFAVEMTENGEKRGYSLSLTPLDISLVGFKAPDTDYVKEICKCYAKIFL